MLIPGISPLASFILALREALVVKLVISGVLSWLFLILALYTSFVTTLFFTTSLSLLKATGRGTNLSISNSSTLIFKLLKPLATFFNLSVSNLSTPDFNLANSTFLTKNDVSIPVAIFKIFKVLLHN